MLRFSKLPAEYQEVEYIESSGTQYINTGVLGKKTIGYDMEVKIKAYGSEYGVLATSTNSARPHYVLQAHSGALRLYLTKSGSTGVTTNVVTYQTDTTDFHVVTYNVENDFKAYYDGAYRATSSVQDTPDIPYPFTIFARNIGGVVQKYSYSIIKYLKMYDAGVLIRNFIPCYRKSDNEIGMYDTVGKTFYTNLGTGTFAKGNDVGIIDAITISSNLSLPKTVKKIEDLNGNILWQKRNNDYTYVEYIESSGTQYINTNFIPNQDTKVEIHLTTKTISGDVNRSIFGSRTGATSNHYGMTIGGNNCWWIGYGTTNGNTGQSVSSNTEYTIVKNKNVTTINGTQMTPATAQTFTCPSNLYLFGMDQSGITFCSSIKLHSCKIYDNGTLVRDFIPCYRNSDNVIGLLDEKNNVFYTNAGSGTFGKGNDL